MRKIFILLAVLLQLTVLVTMAAQREYILRTGRTIYLRTAPVDPRNLFRGDYVRLNYEISTVPIGKFIDRFKNKEGRKGQKIYVVLKEGPNGLYEIDHARTEKPDTEFYITGRLPQLHRFEQPGSPVAINYGIEAYFVQQGKGRSIEDRRGRRNDIQVPLEIQLAVGSNGTAVIKGHRWSPLGIGLEILESPARNDPNGRRSAKMRLTLQNASDAPLAILELPDSCSFSLEPVAQVSKALPLAHNPCNLSRPSNDNVNVLAPGQDQTFDFDFAAERWWVSDEGSPKEIGRLNTWELFRLVYRPPGEADCRHLKDAEIIWHGHLASRAFHGRGNID